MKKKLCTAFGTLLLLCSIPLSGLAASTQPFKDVPPTKHFAEAVNDLAERNIIGGYPDRTFKPGNSITRGQAAAIIAKMVKLDMTNVKNPGFKDVSTENGYYKAIAAMAEANIIGGYADGKYGPNDPIKRGQMASILVKAFDLPRDSNVNNPFTDITYVSSHKPNILIIYKLGLTTGTSANLFSPNAAITRGQAAKMLRATEKAKPAISTMEPSDFGWDKFNPYSAVVDQTKSDIIEAFIDEGKEGYRNDKLQLVPGKEGTTSLKLSGYSKGKEMETKKFIVEVKKVDGQLQVSLTETKEFISQAAKLGTYMTNEDKQNVESISLSTMDGKKLPNATISLADVLVNIEGPGQYIAVVRFKNGKEERHGIEAKTDEKTFQDNVRVIKEVKTAEYNQGTAFDIGKHTIVTENYEQIADVSRDPGTNLFRATGKTEGKVQIDYEHPKTDEGFCEDYTCYENIKYGLFVYVEQIGSIVNVRIGANQRS